MKRKVMFAVKTEILEEMFNSSEWSVRMMRAKTTEEVAEVVLAFCREKGFRVKEIDLPAH